jgi:hypothetical protein
MVGQDPPERQPQFIYYRCEACDYVFLTRSEMIEGALGSMDGLTD